MNGVNGVGISPRYGYTEVAKAGRSIFIAAIIIGVLVGASPWLIRLIMGAEFCDKEWAAGVSSNSPVMLLYTLQVVGGMAIVWWHSVTVKGWNRAIASFAGVMSIAYFAEVAGVHWGWVFGPYHYTAAIPLHIFGVPLIVAPSWEILLYPSFYLALYLLPTEFMGKARSRTQTLINCALIAAVGAVILTLTDLLTDPFWVGYGAWIWHVNGPYVSYLNGGEPISNFVGWFITGFVIMLVYQLVLFTTPQKRHVRSRYLDIYIPLAMYAWQFVFDMGIVIFFPKFYDVAMIGAFGMGGILLMVCTKLYFEMQGAQSNPVGESISGEVLTNMSKIYDV